MLLGLGAATGLWLARPVLGLAIGLVLGVISSISASQYWEYSETLPDTQKSTKDLLEKLSVYVEGKMKRYTLLFGVNGWAFAIVQLMTGTARDLTGQLTLPSLDVGAIVFTAVMTLDIWLWGQLMRREGFAGDMAFTYVGKAILFIIVGLIISGWVLAALP